ncbi:MAG: NADH dehydrogenase [ubiquinone] 1 alpha subcomplex assembly factor 1 [Glaciecola sp.]|jgi:NADH dehydrogenase [ubiquinone] 1 alpha subcomplex assembly factor 1
MRTVLKISLLISLFTIFYAISFNSLSADKPNMNTQIDFINDREAGNWIIVNDTVMGGRSRAGLAIEDDMLMFGGILSLQNNGGFASTRRIDGPLDWKGKGQLEIKVLGDGRAYQFRLRTNRNIDGVAYVTNFKTKQGEVQTFLFDLDEFTPLFRGRLVGNAPKLDYADVSQLGFVLADKKPGEFMLKVAHIKQLI